MENPLVSICIISYNSAKTIVETLDSMARQSYNNIELVISDDCSTDNTVEICQQWLQRHSDVNALVITSEINTGVSGNLNRAMKACHGDWIKIMAADDLLFEYSIEHFMKYVIENDEQICISRLSFFGSNQRNIETIKKHYDAYYERYNKLDKRGKYLSMLKECVLPMPGMFVSKKLMEDIGYINERYPFGEEWPTYITILRKGYNLPYIEEELVRYRRESNTLGGDSMNRLNFIVFKDTIKSFKEYRRPLMLKEKMYLEAWGQTLSLKVYYIGYKDKLSLWDNGVILFLKLMNPLAVTNRIKRFISKK